MKRILSSMAALALVLSLGSLTACDSIPEEVTFPQPTQPNGGEQETTPPQNGQDPGEAPTPTDEKIDQDDAGSGGDAGGTASEALEVSTGENYSGQIGTQGEEDWYTFEAPHGHELNVNFTPGEESGSQSFYIYNPNREEVDYYHLVDPGVTRTIELPDDSDGGMYYLMVDGRDGSYTVEIS